MSILVRFTGAPSLTSERYDEGDAPCRGIRPVPPGRARVARRVRSRGSFRVSEIWDSMEQFETFGQRLMPVLTESGVELAGPPEIVEIHNIVRR